MSEFPKYPLHGLTDTIHYAALIVKKQSKEPELVLLTNGNDLEKNAFAFYKNSVRFKKTDPESYKKYWKNIKNNLQGIRKVYFSPDGIYNQINLNILQNPDNQKYILDEIEIQQLTNTKEILAFADKKDFQDLANFKATLFGRPAYDMDSVAYLVNLELSKANSQNYALRDMRDLRQGSFSDLLGTEKEIVLIDSILKSQKFKTEKYLLSEATEQKIKTLQSPNILHIATHGFFIPDSTSKNPMLNSGVLLAGVSNYFRSEEKPDTDDGILTAHEAQNLHLDHTDLVVLSACETGLGEIKNGEGVYGLQRAFKAAGAKSILMSLWKVDDKVTQELMTLFYQKWTKTANKRQSFAEAQKQIRLIYKNPYFWGAFVLVGE
ncbi:MAG: CHAT domain-containing protein [Bacteroidetes bacterium]|nr:MAG: CHAT domain-containing protein [Bacteroidota bacterium]